jgi:hypothetical protein
VISRSGTDSPYRPTPNQEAKELTSRSPTRSATASPTRCVCASLGVVREELSSPTDEDLLGMFTALTAQGVDPQRPHVARLQIRIGASPTDQADIAVTFSSPAGSAHLSQWGTLVLSGHLGVGTLPNEVGLMPNMDWEAFQRDHHRPHLLVIEPKTSPLSIPRTSSRLV